MVPFTWQNSETLLFYFLQNSVSEIQFSNRMQRLDFSYSGSILTILFQGILYPGGIMTSRFPPWCGRRPMAKELKISKWGHHWLRWLRTLPPSSHPATYLSGAWLLPGSKSGSKPVPIHLHAARRLVSITGVHLPQVVGTFFLEAEPPGKRSLNL